ncbi:hypothetical protein [Neisseria sp. Ec49-e6-T10]|uniref:hypothetical protein n=1 Tax=Neisseria sp. Ec49-e6-T10 TaxID=3140744 RepID=UPI003EBE419B
MNLNIDLNSKEIETMVCKVEKEILKAIESFEYKEAIHSFLNDYFLSEEFSKAIHKIIENELKKDMANKFSGEFNRVIISAARALANSEDVKLKMIELAKAEISKK